MAKKRERLDVIFDILIHIRNEKSVLPTRLLHLSNLPHNIFKTYIDELLNKQMVNETKDKNKVFYTINEKGYAFIEKYKEFIEFRQNFGL